MEKHSAGLNCCIHCSHQRPHALIFLFTNASIFLFTPKHYPWCTLVLPMMRACIDLLFPSHVLSVQRPFWTWWLTSPRSRRSSISWRWSMTLSRFAHARTDWHKCIDHRYWLWLSKGRKADVVHVWWPFELNYIIHILHFCLKKWLW